MVNGGGGGGMTAGGGQNSTAGDCEDTVSPTWVVPLNSLLYLCI